MTQKQNELIFGDIHLSDRYINVLRFQIPLYNKRTWVYNNEKGSPLAEHIDVLEQQGQHECRVKTKRYSYHCKFHCFPGTLAKVQSSPKAPSRKV